MQVLFEHVVLNDIIQQVETVLSPSQGRNHPIPLENVLLQRQKHLQKYPVLSFIVDGLEIVYIRHQQYDFSNAIDEVQVIFYLAKDFIELVGDQLPNLFGTPDLMVLDLLHFDEIMDLAEEVILNTGVVVIGTS